MVMVASHNHIDWTQYEQFAFGRRNKLYRLSKINDGTIVTIFVADKQKKFTMVKSSRPSEKSWVVVESADNNPLGILDLYNHLNSRGVEAPGTVLEAGVFGHAYFGGPIIWNTIDESSSFSKRDQDDLDGRAKDWISGGPTMKQYPNLKAAFHASGVYRIWGCTHMSNVVSECSHANQRVKLKTLRNKPFHMKLYVYKAEECGTLDHLKRNIAQYVIGKKIKHSLEWGDVTGVVAYAGAAAQFLNIPCFAAPPGAGSLYRMTRDGMEGYVSSDGENAPLISFYTREFGSAFVRDDLGYMDYTRMVPASLPDPGWSTERWIRYRDDDIVQTILRLPSGLELYRSEGIYEKPVPMALNSTPGHLYIAPSCRPDHVELRQSCRVLFLASAQGEDCGVLVLANGESILMRRTGPRSPWNRNSNPIEVWTMRLVNFGRWTWEEDTGVTRTTISQGLLEAVQPQSYW